MSCVDLFCSVGWVCIVLLDMGMIFETKNGRNVCSLRNMSVETFTHGVEVVVRTQELGHFGGFSCEVALNSC